MNRETVIHKGAEFSECGKYRYYLIRVWDIEKPLVTCIGLNPSTANATDDDTTITNLTKLLPTYGYGGFYMANLFALISPKPNDLRACPDPLKDNDQWLTYLEGITSEVIFCWGNFKQAEYRAKKIIKRFPDAMCLGKNPNGSPMHPLSATIWHKSKCCLQRFNPR